MPKLRPRAFGKPTVLAILSNARIKRHLPQRDRRSLGARDSKRWQAGPGRAGGLLQPPDTRRPAVHGPWARTWDHPHAAAVAGAQRHLRRMAERRELGPGRAPGVVLRLAAEVVAYMEPIPVVR